MKKVLLILMIIFMTGCTNSGDATKALTALSFADIKMTGYHWFACAEDDFYHTGFTAKNPQGRIVSGTVCSGILFKNSTVRF